MRRNPLVFAAALTSALLLVGSGIAIMLASQGANPLGSSLCLIGAIIGIFYATARRRARNADRAR